MSPSGFSAWRAGPKPTLATVATPAAHTSRRELHIARQVSRTALMRTGSARRAASHPVAGAGSASGRTVTRPPSNGAAELARSVMASSLAPSIALSRTARVAGSAVSGFIALDREPRDRRATGRRTRSGAVISKLRRCLDKPEIAVAGTDTEAARESSWSEAACSPARS